MVRYVVNDFHRNYFGLGPSERPARRANLEQHAASINPYKQITDDDGPYW